MNRRIALSLIGALWTTVTTANGRAESPLGSGDGQGLSAECDSHRSVIDFVSKTHGDSPEGKQKIEEEKAALDRCLEQAEARIANLNGYGSAAERWAMGQDQRIAEENKKKEADADEIRNTPAAMRIVFGAIFCAMKDLKTSALSEIAKQKKYARLGGMIDKAAILDLQNQVRRADEVTAEQRRVLLTDYKGIVPEKCTHSAVKQVLWCRAHGASHCDEMLQRYVSFVPEDDGD